MLKAIILTIGDELLNGQTVNTNQAWMAQQLNLAGVSVARMLTVSDKDDDIISAVKEAFSQAEIVLVTGGLGPTNDDRTRDCLCKVFGSELVFDQRVYDKIAAIFRKRQRTMFPEIEDLAQVPDNCIVIENNKGLAPGMLFSENGKMLAAIPGVPSEMKDMMNTTVLRYIKENFKTEVIFHKHILTAGVGESVIADKIKELEANLPDDVTLAYLPSMGKVKLRLTASGTDPEKVKASLDGYWPKIAEAIREHVYGYDDDELEAVIGKMLLERDLCLGTAESCTGGNIARAITSIPGSAGYYKGTVVSYDNKVKTDVLGVNKKHIDQYGAVSEQVVADMIDGALKVLDVDVAIAASGIAGPGGETEGKPVGTVYLGIGNKEKKVVRHFMFSTQREQNMELSTVISLVMLRRFLLGTLE